ncbi:MAG: hypothetical protein ACYCOU_04205 [Sulfobacillus sp.]
MHSGKMVFFFKQDYFLLEDIARLLVWFSTRYKDYCVLDLLRLYDDRFDSVLTALLERNIQDFVSSRNFQYQMMNEQQIITIVEAPDLEVLIDNYNY